MADRVGGRRDGGRRAGAVGARASRHGSVRDGAGRVGTVRGHGGDGGFLPSVAGRVAVDEPGLGRPGLGELRHHGDQFTAFRAHLPAKQPLDHGDRLRSLGDHPAPVQVAGDRPHKPVIHFLLVDDHFLVVSQPAAQMLIEVGKDANRVLIGGKRYVGPGQFFFVVGIQVVGRNEQRHHPGKALALQPQDLFPSTHFSVVAGVTTRPLAHRQFVLYDPREKPWLYAGGPFTSHIGRPRHLMPTSFAASAVAFTSWARTTAAPFTIAHTAPASEPSRRSSAGPG